MAGAGSVGPGHIAVELTAGKAIAGLMSAFLFRSGERLPAPCIARPPHRMSNIPN